MTAEPTPKPSKPEIRVEDMPLKTWAKARPFVPFVISMANGRQLVVTNPELMTLGAQWSTVHFIDENRYDRIVIVQHDQINTIDAYNPDQSHIGGAAGD